MRKKMVDTLSGARYAIYEDGRVERAGTAHISWSLHQYEEGELRKIEAFDALLEGDRLLWYGIQGDDVEPITSSVIMKITDVVDGHLMDVDCPCNPTVIDYGDERVAE